MEDLFEQHWNPLDLEGTLLALQSLRLRVKGSGDPFLYCQLQGRIAHCLTELRRFEAVQEVLNDLDFVLMDAAQRLPDADPVARRRAQARTLLERGRFFQMGGWPDSARPCLEAARELGDEAIAAQAQELLG